MIVFAPPPQSAAPPVARPVAEHSISSRSFHCAVLGAMPASDLLIGDAGDSVQLQPNRTDVREDFDWNDAKTQREFIRLEQRVLARQGTAEEQARYATMKRDRDSRIFADRYLQDYAEIQRLRKLSEKLAEVQQYLRPVRLG